MKDKALGFGCGPFFFWRAYIIGIGGLHGLRGANGKVRKQANEEGYDLSGLIWRRMDAKGSEQVRDGAKFDGLRGAKEKALNRNDSYLRIILR